MNCPFCGAPKAEVTDTRPVSDGTAIRRRRECRDCRKRFTTYETLHPTAPKVVKRDGRREPFDADKLRRSLELATTKRPVAEGTLDELVKAVELSLMSVRKREVGSRRIGQMVMRKLEKLDTVAYVRFASVYRNFQDAGAFRELVDGIGRPAAGKADDGQLPLALDGEGDGKGDGGSHGGDRDGGNSGEGVAAGR